MTVEEKIEIIKSNKRFIVGALNVYLDSVYNLTDDFFDEDMKLKLFLSEDNKTEQYLLELREKAEYYEKIRAKLLSDDFNLSLAEINYINLTLLYSAISMEKEVKKIQNSISVAKNIYNNLLSGEEN